MKPVKITICIALLFCISNALKAQSYNFTTEIETYTDLQNPVSLNNGVVWDMADYIIPIGFEFMYFKSYIDTLFFLDSAPCILSSSDEEGGNHQIIIPFGTTLVDRGYPTNHSLSPLSYELSGEVGNRILKIEWKNVGFMMEFYMNETLNDYTNFQMWLYEKDGKIEIHYGPTQILFPQYAYVYESGASVSLVPKYDYDMDTISNQSLFLSGNPINPSMIQTNDYVYLDGTIPANTIYMFNNLCVNVKTLDYNSSLVYPNPVTDRLHIRADFKNPFSTESYIMVRDLLGKVLYSDEVISSNNEFEIPVSFLRNGLYQIAIFNGKDYISSSFIKL